MPEEKQFDPMTCTAEEFVEVINKGDFAKAFEHRTADNYQFLIEGRHRARTIEETVLDDPNFLSEGFRVHLNRETGKFELVDEFEMPCIVSAMWLDFTRV